MKIPQLLKFISLYNLAGEIEDVKLTIKDKVLSTSFAASDRSLAGTVTQKVFDVDDVEFGVFSTAMFKNRVKSLMGEDATMSFLKSDTRVTTMILKDTFKTSANILLADMSVIPPAPKIKEPTSYEVEIPITSTFIDTYIRVKDSLPDTESFTVKPNADATALEFIIGWSPTTNTDRTEIEITPAAGKDTLKDPISFNAKYFRSILAANDGLGTATLKISAKGLAVISFDSPEYTTTYYLVQKKLES